jgi:hypothetical protein
MVWSVANTGFDAKTSRDDAADNRRQRDILFRKHSAQIEQDAAFVYPGNDGRI